MVGDYIIHLLVYPLIGMVFLIKLLHLILHKLMGEKESIQQIFQISLAIRDIGICSKNSVLVPQFTANSLVSL